MRYSKDHKNLTRQRILDAAAKAFRRDGIVATGVSGLMAEAGMTQGGFYTHFASKDALVAAVAEQALAQTRDQVATTIANARAAGTPPLEAVIDAYLGEFHFRSRPISCALASLGSELSFQSLYVRQVAHQGVQAIVDLLAAELSDGERHRAAPLFGLLAGTLQMAWIAPHAEAQLAILDDGRRTARALIAKP